MDMPLTTLVSPEMLQRNLHHPLWIVVDVRHDLANTNAGHAAYAAGHIPDAIFVHLDAELSAPITGFNGRHPLPDPDAFAVAMARLGVASRSQLVVYDDQGGMMASRLWWMMKWIGHSAVAVLDGGWRAWVLAGGGVETSEPPGRTHGDLRRRESLVSQVSAAEVLTNLESRRRLVIDARAADRFRGENETLDPVGGHIPGARNRPFRDNLAPNGRFKGAPELRAEWLAILGDTPPSQAIAQCGSGVTACHNLLAMEIAGLPGAALYPGSWSEWCADPLRPVER